MLNTNNAIHFIHSMRQSAALIQLIIELIIWSRSEARIKASIHRTTSNPWLNHVSNEFWTYSYVWCNLYNQHDHSPIQKYITMHYRFSGFIRKMLHKFCRIEIHSRGFHVDEMYFHTPDVVDKSSYKTGTACLFPPQGFWALRTRSSLKRL